MRSVKGHLGLMWAANGLLILMMILAFVLVDGNGRLPGLSQIQSVIAIGTIIGFGLAVDAYLGIIDRKRRPIAVALVLLYVVMLIPLFGWPAN